MSGSNAVLEENTGRSFPADAQQPPTPADPSSSQSLRVYAVLVPLGLLLLLWLQAFRAQGFLQAGPAGKNFGADYAMFIGGAQVLKDGGNPYDHQLLYRTERDLLHRQHLAVTNLKSVVRVGNPPLFFWALEPLAGLPFQTTALIWILGLYLLLTAGLLATLRALGWRRWVLPAVFFLLMPQVVSGAFYGNVVGLVFAALALSLALAPRYPLVAGALLTLAWLKPPVALPLALLIILFHAPRRRAIIGSFTLATALLLLATLLATGRHSLVLWVGGLTGYSHSMSIQPEIASLSGLYVRWAPNALRLGFEAIALAVGAGLTAETLRRFRGRQIPLAAVGWLWFVWLLVTPYAHSLDEILLTIPVLAILGRDGYRVTQRVPVLTLYLMFFSLLLIEWMPFNLSLLPFPLLAVALLVYFDQVPREARA